MSDKIQYRVEGMTCAACAVTIQKTLSKVAEVQHAEVSYAGKSALVELKPTAQSDQPLLDAVSSIGYKLVPESLDPREREQASVRRLHQLKIRVIWASVFSAPVFVLGMWVMDPSWSPWVQLALSLPVMFFAGSEFFIRAFKLLLKGHTNMDTLVAMGTGTAFLSSAVITFRPELAHESVLGHTIFFESAVVVITLVLLGRYLEERASHRTSEAVSKLLHLQPERAIRLTQVGEEEVPLAEVKPGDRLRVRPGDRIPVDGEVEEGESAIDESMLTGEAMPVPKEKGHPVYAGTLNQQGVLVMQAQKTGFATRLSRIIRLVREAQSSRAPIQQLVDRISAVFVPIVIVIALVAGILWYLLGPDPNGINAMVVAITVLVVACPCALGLATPTAIMVGMGRGAGEGILIRNAESLQKANRITDMLLDKTGTLTEGRPEVVRHNFEEGNPDVWEQLWAAERQSTHPLAGAICRWLEAKGVSRIDPPVSVLNFPGKGMIARFGEATLRIGSLAWARERGVPLSEEVSAMIAEAEGAGEGIVVVTSNDQFAALLTLADPIRKGAKAMVEKLEGQGKRVWMVTGDAQQPAELVAGQAGISLAQVRFGQSPEGKLGLVRELQAAGCHVALVGDGINDAPALTAADLGIAIGTGSDIALESAGVVLSEGSLAKLVGVFSLSRATMATLKRNLFWAFLYNCVMIPLAAGLFYPLTHWVLDPMWAGAAMAASSISVVASSLLLRRWRMPKVEETQK